MSTLARARSGFDTARAAAMLGVGRVYTGYHTAVRRDPLMSLFTAGGRRDPYAIYEQLRTRGRVQRSSAGMWSTVDHAVADAVLRSRQISVGLDSDPSAEALDLSLLQIDPPDHTRLRALVAPAFTARRMRHQEEVIGTAVGRLADDVAARLAHGPVDLMEAFAKPLPVVMITTLLGIPDAEVATLNRYGNAIGGALDGVQSMRHRREIDAAVAGLTALFERLIELRRREPGDDLISHLVAAEDEQKLTHTELLALAQVVLVAGFETTVNLIGNATSALLDRPEVWRRLVEDPSLAERVSDETLRWDPPVQMTGRQVITDLDADGVHLAAGTRVVVLLAGANRDPQIYDNPLAFDIERDNPRPHLGFGAGIHHCVGRPLAELEGRLALAALAERVPGLQRAAPETLGTGLVLHGRRTLPVRAAGSA